MRRKNMSRKNKTNPRISEIILEQSRGQTFVNNWIVECTVEDEIAVETFDRYIDAANWKRYIKKRLPMTQVIIWRL
jgi:hypothetical protein